MKQLMAVFALAGALGSSPARAQQPAPAAPASPAPGEAAATQATPAATAVAAPAPAAAAAPEAAPAGDQEPNAPGAETPAGDKTEAGGAAAASAAADSAQAPAAAAEALAPEPQGAIQKIRFRLNPLADTLTFVAAGTFTLTTQAIIGSGDLGAHQPGPVENLPPWDREWASRAARNPTPDTAANITMAAVGVGVVGYSVANMFRYSVGTGFTDLFLYMETAVVNLAIGNVVKLAVRRSRPQAYARAEMGIEIEEGETDMTLSFYSSHTATVAGLTGTAIYLAFARDSNPYEKWITLGLGTFASVFVASERIGSLSHFPTDVVTGLVVGGMVGVLVPYFHRVTDDTYGVYPMTDGKTMGGVILRGKLM